MIFRLALAAVPIAYVIVLINLLVRREPKGIVASALFAVAAVATGLWAITQSRSSTAPIGALTLPLLGAIAGFLGLIFGRYRSSPRASQRIGAWAALVVVVLLISRGVMQGEQTKSKNRGREDTQTALLAEIARNRVAINLGLTDNPGRESAWLDSSVRARMHDRAFLFAALPNDSISPQLLDTLANSPDMAIALEAVRNSNTSAGTLERVYRTKSYPEYFLQALAGHHHTPPAILLELYRRPSTMTGLAIWFAGNPATPNEILDEIARTTSDKFVISALLENPSLDCELLSRLAVNLMKSQNRDADNPNVMRLNERLPTVCRNTTP